MGIRNGSISYARFKVAGSGGRTPPRDVDAGLLEALAGGQLRPGGVGEPPPVEFGWCGGRHVYDGAFGAEHNVFGRALLFGLRVDANKVPAEIRRAYRAMAEAGYAADSGTGFLSRREKTAAKEEAEERCRSELAEGRYRRSKMVEVLWDLERSVVLAPAFSDAATTGLRDLFHSTFDLKLQPLSSGGLAFDVLSSRGLMREYEDLQPSAFTPPPAGAIDPDQPESADGTRPSVPWAHVTPEASDFIGNEFLLWLWWRCERDEGVVDTAEAGSVALAVERSLDMQCAWDATGKQSLTADGVARAPEARVGLKNGKWPRKAGLIVAAGGEQFELTLQADRFILTGVKVEKPEEDIGSPRELVEHRLGQVRTLDEALVGVYDAFLRERTASGWTTRRDRIGAWMRGRSSSPSSSFGAELKPASQRAEPPIVETQADAAHHGAPAPTM